MTELQFLIDLLLNHKLNPTTKKLVADRIGQVEASMNRGPSQPIYRPNPTAQAPSTQALLEKHESEVSNSTITVPPLTQRVVGGEVSTGPNIRGKKKW